MRGNDDFVHKLDTWLIYFLIKLLLVRIYLPFYMDCVSLINLFQSFPVDLALTGLFQPRDSRVGNNVWETSVRFR